MLSSIEVDAESVEAVNTIRVKAHNLATPESPRKSPLRVRNPKTPSKPTSESPDPTTFSIQLNTSNKPKSKRVGTSQPADDTLKKKPKSSGIFRQNLLPELRP